LSRTNRDGDAVTRRGSCLRCVVVMWLRPSIRCVPIGSHLPVSTPIPDAIADLARPRPRISASIVGKNRWGTGPEHPGKRHYHQPQPSQILKSP